MQASHVISWRHDSRFVARRRVDDSRVACETGQEGKESLDILTVPMAQSVTSERDFGRDFNKSVLNGLN